MRAALFFILVSLAACSTDRGEPDDGPDEGAYGYCDFTSGTSCSVEGEICQNGNLEQFICRSGHYVCYDPEHGCLDFAMPPDLADHD